MKKIIYIIMFSLIIVGLTGCGNSNKLNESSKNDQEDINIGSDNKVNENRKSLVLYFSATGTTKGVAEKIATISNSDIVEIIPKEKYTSSDLDYSNNNSRANREQNSSSARPEIENQINLNEYNVIYLGYPIWWGDIPKIILTLLDTYNLDGKTVIPFCTSGSTGISQSQSTLESYNKNIKWINGKRFSSNVSHKELESWINEFNL
ncbi:MAG: flavodoxin [Clostridium sp.]|nr:flavodoxin [Clostridium sp.]MCM1444371.1 flavodoxin [Candidatus Amulumruptor caecigallinarius]